MKNNFWVPAEAISRVLAHIEAEELISLTADLVRINSVWDPGAGTCEKPVAEYVARWARAQGFKVDVEEVAPSRPNVMITYSAAPGPRQLMFEGHTDVVTPGDLSTWHFDPFGAEITGGRMYGRGTNDTKGNLAAMLLVMAALKRAALPLTGSVLGGVLCDEEDQMLGVRHFINQGWADRVTAAVICEPQNGLICTAQKGAIRVKYTLHGRMSHGAMPLVGLNTAPAVARIIDGLHQLELNAVEQHSQDPLLGWPSFTPTVIKAPATGPPQLNVLPREAVVLVDVRTNFSQSHDDLREELRALASSVETEVHRHYEAYDRRLGHNRQRTVRITTEFLTDRPCTRTNPADPVVRAADMASRLVTGREPEYGGVPGATDGTFLWALKNIPIVTMGAGDREVPHQSDEWVDLDQLVETAKIYAVTALGYLWPAQV